MQFPNIIKVWKLLQNDSCKINTYVMYITHKNAQFNVKLAHKGEFKVKIYQHFCSVCKTEK